MKQHDAKVKEAVEEFIEFCINNFPIDIMSTDEALQEMKKCYAELKEQSNDR